MKRARNFDGRSSKHAEHQAFSHEMVCSKLNKHCKGLNEACLNNHCKGLSEAPELEEGLDHFS